MSLFLWMNIVKLELHANTSGYSSYFMELEGSLHKSLPQVPVLAFKTVKRSSLQWWYNTRRLDESSPPPPPHPVSLTYILIIMPSTAVSFKQSLNFRFYSRSCVCTSHLSHSRHMPLLFHSLWFDRVNNYLRKYAYNCKASHYAISYIPF
jgi:hypothetical protein